jgi:predicted enzyme related to lactoylglutathione lyase
MFTVEDIDDTLARLGKLGAKVVDEVVDYEDVYRLCSIRVPKEFSGSRTARQQTACDRDPVR